MCLVWHMNIHTHVITCSYCLLDFNAARRALTKAPTGSPAIKHKLAQAELTEAVHMFLLTCSHKQQIQKGYAEDSRVFIQDAVMGFRQATQDAKT